MAERDTPKNPDRSSETKEVAKDDRSADRTYGDNVDPRHEPENMERHDLAPPGSTGTIKSAKPIADIPAEQKEAIAHRYDRLQQQQERDRLRDDLKPGVRGEERERPFLSKRDFDRSNDLDR